MDENARQLGPLARLAGTWERDEGLDIAPSADRDIMETRFRERAVFENMGWIENHEQKLGALRYSTKAYRLGEDDAFHEELGYWLWDGANGQILRCFLVLRGVSILAGGSATADDQRFSLAADVGRETYGLCSNLFLDAEFKTLRYELNVDLEEEGVFRYEEDTQLQLKGQPEIFHHRDSNRLRRLG